MPAWGPSGSGWVLPWWGQNEQWACERASGGGAGSHPDFEALSVRLGREAHFLPWEASRVDEGRVSSCPPCDTTEELN